MMPPRKSPPYEWHIDLRRALAAQRATRGSTVVTDLRPNQHAWNLSLYEIRDVWGYVHDEWWTSLMLRLDGLFVHAERGSIKRKRFVRRDADIETSIFEFLYVEGSVKRGTVVGRWTPPPASPINAALLFPESLRYFLTGIAAFRLDLMPAPGVASPGRARTVRATARRTQDTRGGSVPRSRRDSPDRR
jgi:hypothetical protein